ncbi:MAG: hypothetical protein ABIJ09_07665 [Pseudomonadota bacterium]
MPQHLGETVAGWQVGDEASQRLAGLGTVEAARGLQASSRLRQGQVALAVPALEFAAGGNGQGLVKQPVAGGDRAGLPQELVHHLVAEGQHRALRCAITLELTQGHAPRMPHRSLSRREARGLNHLQGSASRRRRSFRGIEIQLIQRLPLGAHDVLHLRRVVESWPHLHDGRRG